MQARYGCVLPSTNSDIYGINFLQVSETSQHVLPRKIKPALKELISSTDCTKVHVHTQIIRWKILVDEKGACQLKPKDWGWRITGDNNTGLLPHTNYRRTNIECLLQAI